jgi:two-component system phosphate regulon response regulator PhoB
MTSLLVADDTPSVRKLFRMIFHSGYRLVEAGDGQEALRQMLAERPAVAILDVAMPELNGLDLCRAIRRDPRVAATAVIVITANGGPADRAAALAAGADHFISKPFSPSVMYQLVESIVARQAAIAS